MPTKAAKRIYKVNVKDEHGQSLTTRLVRASHPNRAISHVADGMISAEVATQDELVTLLTNPDGAPAIEDVE